MIYPYYPDSSPGEGYYFRTQAKSVYTASFLKSTGYVDPKFRFKDDIYSFSFAVRSGGSKDMDLGIRETLQGIILDWFKKNNKILMFIIRDSDNRSRKRQMYFERWYDNYSKKSLDPQFDFILAVLENPNECSTLGFLLKRNYVHRAEFRDNLNSIIETVQALK